MNNQCSSPTKGGSIHFLEFKDFMKWHTTSERETIEGKTQRSINDRAYHCNMTGYKNINKGRSLNAYITNLRT